MVIKTVKGDSDDDDDINGNNNYSTLCEFRATTLSERKCKKWGSAIN